MPGLGEEKRKKRKEKIFTTAVELFNKKGFSQTTMKEIAEHADLAVGTLYNYFSSKNELLLEIMTTKTKEMSSRNEERIRTLCSSTSDPKKILGTILKEIIDDFNFLNKQSWLELFQAIFSSPHHIDRGVQLDFELIDVLQSMIEELQANNLLRSGANSTSASYMLYSIILFSFMNYIYYSGFSQKKLQEEIDYQLDILLKGLQNGDNREREIRNQKESRS